MRPHAQAKAEELRRLELAPAAEQAGKQGELLGLGPEAPNLEPAVPGRQVEGAGLQAGEQAPRQLKRKDPEPETLPAAAPISQTPGGDGSAPASESPAAKRSNRLGSAGAACSAGDAPRVGAPLDSAGAAGATEAVPPASDQPCGALMGSAAPDPGDALPDGVRLDDAARAPAGALPDSMHLDGAEPGCEGAPPASMHPTSTAAERDFAPPTSLRALDAAPEPEGAPRASMQDLGSSGAPPLPMEGVAAALGGAEGWRPGSGQAALPQVPAPGRRADMAGAPPVPLFHGAGGADLNPKPGLQPAGAPATSSMEWLGAGSTLGQGAQACWAGQEAAHGAGHGLPGFGSCAGFGGLAGAFPAHAPLPGAAAAWDVGVGADRDLGLMQQPGLGMPYMADMVPLGPWPLSLALPMAHPGMGNGFGPGFGLGVPPWQAEAPLCATTMAEAGARAAKWHAATGLGAGAAPQELHLQQLRQQHAWSAQAAQAAGAWAAQGPAPLCQYPCNSGMGAMPHGWRSAAPGAAAQPTPGPALLANGSVLDPAGAAMGAWHGAGAAHAPLKCPFPALPQPQAVGHSAGSALSSGVGLGAAAVPPGSARPEGEVWNQFLLPCTSPCKARAG